VNIEFLKDNKDVVSEEEIMIKNILIRNNKLHECFIGYYYDGKHNETEAIRIDKNVLHI